ncbi:proline--tRNA ligase [Helicobacter sp. 23-1045]
MKFSTLFAPTTKEEPKDCVLKSHSILIRGGFIKQIGSGIYSFLPLGKIVLDKVQKIVKDEMDKAGANEVRLGFVTPAELWEKSKRFDKYGKELLVFRDRKDNRFVLGPTHEEAVVDCAKGLVKSYKQLPLNLYQIHTKFRDEIRPRFGLMRAREFVMKDGYSFHADSADLDREFALMEQTYRRIFDRLGVKYRVVEADSGAIGGSGSKEFMLLADSGEDDIVICEKCDYASNIEAATRKPRPVPKSSAPQADFAKFHTPNVTTIKALSEFFKIDEYWTMKCVAKKAVFGRNSGNLSLESRNSFSGNHSADSLDLERSQTASLVSRPKSSENYESTTAIPSVVDSANLESKIDSSLRDSQREAKQPSTKNQNANSSIVSEKSGLCSHEQGNRTNGSLTKRVANLPDFSPQDEFATAPCFFFIRGCDELNLTKALNAIPNAIDLVDLPKDELESLGLKSGFIGAYGLQHITKSPYIYFDNELRDSANLICGANEADYHFVGVDLATFSDLQYADLVEVKKGDFCPKCGAKGIDSTLDITKGIELGHIFKLGTRYSAPMEATFLDSNGRAKPFVMGCYGIGVSRILPAILEQKADSKGAIWGALAPFALTIIISNTKNADEVDFATKIYDALCANFGTAEILLDDRDERFGVKMADFELLGVRFALIVGKELQNGKVELINRADLSRKALDSRDFGALVEQINAALSAD